MQKRLSCEGGTIADHRQRENADSVLIGAFEVRLIPRTAQSERFASFNRVGNAPRVERR